MPLMPDPEQAEGQWQKYRENSNAALDSRRIYSVLYEHDGDKIFAKVGEPPKVFKKITGPGGGYRKDAGHQRLGQSIGQQVTAIIDTGNYLSVYMLPGDSYWANPITVGYESIETSEDFERDL